MLATRFRHLACQRSLSIDRLRSLSATLRSYHKLEQASTPQSRSTTSRNMSVSAQPEVMAQPGAKDVPPAPAVPEEVPSGMEAEAQLLESLCEVPNLSRLVARQQPGTQGTLLTLYMSQRNLAANSQRKYALHATMSPHGDVGPFSLPMELPDCQLIATSPNGQQQLVVKPGTDNVSVVHQLWRANRMVWEIQVPKTLHGSVYSDGYFGTGATWSPDGSAVVYVADVPPTSRTPSWGGGADAPKDVAFAKSWRGVGEAVDDWGELNTGKRGPAVFVLDTRTRRVMRVGGTSLPSDLSCGQPTWTRDSGGVVWVGWRDRDPELDVHRRLGVVHCYNRPCHLYHVAVTTDEQGALSCGGPATRLTSGLRSAHSPGFTPNGTTLVFASYHASAVQHGTHNGAAQLYKLPWPQALAGDTAPTLVVDLVQDPSAVAAAATGGTGGQCPAPSGRRPFPGLYLSGGLPEDGFIDNSTLLVTSTWYSQTSILAINITNGEVTPITPVDQAPITSWSLMATTTAPGRVFAVQVAFDTPPRLMVAPLPHGLPGVEEPEEMAWTTVGSFGQELPQQASRVLAGLEYRVLQVTPRKDAEGQAGHVFETLVLAPRSRSGPLPTVIAPHGGPHTSVTLGWYLPYAFLAHLGYTVLMPNYRGSTGYGQAPLLSLPGRIGRQDVDDCMDAVQAAVEAGFTDVSRVAVCGGSHGGFLTGHLVGQFPDAFKCAIMRNPVCNISLMVGTSDIPDWCFVEVLGCQEGLKRVTGVPRPADLAAFYAASPVSHLSSVKAPMLMLLGAKDRRVPLSDGQQYAAALQGRGVPVRVLAFPEDSHALDKPQTEFEQWLNVAWWLKMYC